MSSLSTRVLGKTGAKVSVLGLGSGSIGFQAVTHEEGVAVVRRCLEKGITYFDTAHHYESEEIVGDGLLGHRDDVFLVTKTVKRNKAGAASDIEKSLRSLKTDRLDVLFMHCVNTISDLDAVLAPNGSLAAALEAQAAGKVRFLGITGHARPNILALALDRFPFDVVLSAMGIYDTLVSAPEAFILPAARRHNAGLVGMKVLGAGLLVDHVELAIRHTLGLGVDCAIVGLKTPEEVDQAVAAVASGPKPLSEAEHARLVAIARKQVSGDAGRDNPPWWLADCESPALRDNWVGAAR